MMIYGVLLFLVFAVLSKEALFVNEEILVILSFLLFLTGFFQFAGESMGKSLDQQSDELVQKLNNVYSAQLVALERAQTVSKKAQDITSRVVPAYSLLLYSVDQLNSIADILVEEIAKSKLEVKLMGLVALEMETTKEVVDAKIMSYVGEYVNTPMIHEDKVVSFSVADSSLGLIAAKALAFTSYLDSYSVREYFATLAFLNCNSVSGLTQN